MNYLADDLYNFVKEDKAIFDFIQEKGSSGICIIDIKNTLNKWLNQTLVKTLGYSKIGDLDLKNLVHADDAHIIPSVIENALLTPQRVFEHNIRLKRNDGDFFKMNCWSKVLLKNNQPFRLLTCIATNPHDHELHELKKIAKEQEYKYQKLFNSMQEGVYLHKIVYDDKNIPIDYIIIDANPISEKHLKIPIEFAKGKKATDLYQTDEAPFLKEYYATIKTNIPFVKTEYFAPLQKWFNISAFRTGEHEFATVFSDITEVKTNAQKLEAALENNLILEEKHSFLFNNMSQGVVYHNKTGQVIYANNAASEILGLSLDQLTGKTSYDPRWRSINEDGTEFKGSDHPAIVTLQSGRAVKNCIMGIFNPKKDTYSWININSVPKYKKGETTFSEVLVTFEDITEIRLAKAQAEKSDMLKSAFLANMSHEIRTPLNAIMGFAYLLKSNNLHVDEKNNFLNLINSSGERLLTLINDIIDISKIDAEEIVINYKFHDINSLIDELESQYLIQSKNKRVTIKGLKGDPISPFNIKTDKVRLLQIFTNLIDNALKFTNAGEITFGYELTSNTILLFVSDTGVGIPEEEQSIIFERFRQLNNEQVDSLKGTGLGLAIVKGLTTLMNGTINLESEVGKGTSFLITLPLTIQEHSVETKQEKKKPIHNNTRKKILVADDEEMNLIYIQALLEDYNYEIIQVYNGLDAVNIIEKDDVDIILMDIKMPVMNGIEATKKITEIKPDIPIILQTAYAMPEDIEKYSKTECKAYITKPIDAEKLLKLIENYT